MIFRIFATLVLIAIIGGSLFLGRQQRETETPTAARRPTEDLGYGARDAQLIETGADGRPKYTVNAKLIEQHPKDGSVQLEVVHLIFDNVDGSRWTADAARGDILNDGDTIDLMGDVHVSGLLPGTQEPTEIRSERLSFDTRSNVVTSADPVIFSWAGRQIHSVGIAASLQDSRVQLESAVHALFQP
jgi:LPS export ABC transporter protein LptC